MIIKEILVKAKTSETSKEFIKCRLHKFVMGSFTIMSK